MTIINHPSPNHSPRKPAVRVDTIVLHHTVTSASVFGDRAALAWLAHPKSTVSAHYVIGHDGKVYRLVPEDRTAWHAGESCLPWEAPKKGASVNPRSIGIELVNPGDGKTPFTEEQYAALGQLLPDIVRRYGWAVVNVAFRAATGATVALPTGSALAGHEESWILGHRHVAQPPGRKTDPADNFDWDRVRSLFAVRVA